MASVVNRSDKKAKEPDEKIKVEPSVAIIKELVSEKCGRRVYYIL